MCYGYFIIKYRFQNYMVICTTTCYGSVLPLVDKPTAVQPETYLFEVWIWWSKNVLWRIASSTAAWENEQKQNEDLEQAHKSQGNVFK